MGSGHQISKPDKCIYNIHACQPALLPHLDAMLRALRSLPPVPTHALGLSISLRNRSLFCADTHEAALYAAGHGFVARSVRSKTPPSLDLDDAALTFHYLNRICNVFVRRPALPFSLTPFRELYLRGVSVFQRGQEPPPDTHYPVRSAILDLCAEADALGSRVLPPSIRLRVQTHIQAWTGEEMGSNRSWVENYLADFSPAERAIGRLALLTALASHQVDSVVVESVRPATPRHLLAIAAWSSAQAVLHMRDGALTECPHSLTIAT